MLMESLIAFILIRALLLITPYVKLPPPRQGMVDSISGLWGGGAGWDISYF
jgi:hypothetical protein